MKIKLLFAAATLLLWGDAALGCVCISIPNVADSLKKADAVFVGKVESISEKRAKLKVERVWKGKIPAEVVMLMGGSVFEREGKEPIEFPFTSCDYEFDVGEQYLIYASSFGGNYYRTWVCTRTRGLQYAQEDLKELGEGKPPEEPRSSVGRMIPSAAKPNNRLQPTPRLRASHQPSSRRRLNACARRG